jgi:uncharacterized protein (TIGR03435 family)
MRRAGVLATTLTLTLAAGLAAQAPQSFEVASVKPSAPDTGEPGSAFPRMVPANNRLTITNMPLRLLVRIALDVQDFQVSGGPASLMLSKFDISAKAEDGTELTTKNTLAMLRTLLADRFKLKTHTEAREMPVYALVLARDDGKLGPDMKPSTSDCAADEKACAVIPAGRGPGTFGMRATGQPLDGLVQLLGQATGRTVVDKTGLKGLFDFQLQFDPEVMLRMVAQQGVNVPPSNSPAPSSPPSESPALMTAIRDQLGLKLDPQRGPVDVFVIDHVEAPTTD